MIKILDASENYIILRLINFFCLFKKGQKYNKN